MEFNLFDKLRKPESTEDKIQKAREYRSRMSDEEFKTCQEIILVQTISDLEDKLKAMITTSKQTLLWLDDEEVLKQVAKRIEKKIVESESWKLWTLWDKNFVKGFLPIVVEAIKLCIKDLK